MLSGISWGIYIEAVIILIVLWYGYIISRYYSDRLKGFFRKIASGRGADKRTVDGSGPFAEFKEPFDALKDAEELYDKILMAFTESDAGGVSRTEFLNYISFILSDYPFVKQSSLRSKINFLTQQESLKYPGLELTSEDMERLWESGQ